jgi:hypothetical protein
MSNFEIVSEITHIETIAAGTSVRDRAMLNKLFGKGRWRKMKGMAYIREPSGNISYAEIHWYEASGIGRKQFKVKRRIRK